MTPQSRGMDLKRARKDKRLQMFSQEIVDKFPVSKYPFDRKEFKKMIDSLVCQVVSVHKQADKRLKEDNRVLAKKVALRIRELLRANKLLEAQIEERIAVERIAHIKNVILKMMARIETRGKFANSVVKLIRGVSGASSVGIRLLNGKGRIPYEAHTGFEKEFLEQENQQSIERSDCVCIRIFKNSLIPADKPQITPFGSFYCEDTLVFFNRVPDTDKSRYLDLCVKFNLRSVAMVPVRYKDKVIGVLHLADQRPRMLSVKMIESIEQLALHIGEGIYKLDVADKAQRQDELAKVNLQRAQKELVEAKRLSDIGTLAATVAHELRNPLAAIRMAVYNIKRKAQNPVIESHLLNIETKLSDSEQIINNLLFYSKIRMPHCVAVNIYNILASCIEEISNRTAKYRIKIIKSIEPLREIYINADPVQLREVFVNIFNNAIDAFTQEPGTIEIEVQVGAQRITVKIKDSGCGIGRENLEKVFEPFFSTKAKGTGLGLAVCKQIVHLHEGDIWIESEKGKGTQVFVALPIRIREDV